MRQLRRWSLPIVVSLLLSACAGTPPANPPVVEAPEVAKEKVPEVPMAKREAQAIAAVDDANSIFFGLGKTTVDAEGEARLRVHAQRLKDDPKLVVTLLGYTDDLGSRSYNLAIAEQRVNNVYQLLRRFGVPLSQLRRYDIGREKVALACRSEACRRKMRRVELDYGD